MKVKGLVVLAALFMATVCIGCKGKTPSYLIVEGTEVKGFRDGVPAKLKIPKGITVIGNGAFKNFKSLESISFPKTLTEIGQNAFQNCTSLKSVNIPKGVKEIGKNAFSGCTSLESLTLPSNKTFIGVKAFYGCKKLTSVTIPNGIRTIGQNSFQYCTSLEKIIFEDTKAVWYAKYIGTTSADEIGTMDDPVENAKRLTDYMTYYIYTVDAKSSK